MNAKREKESITIEAITIEEAIKKALKTLHVTKRDVTIKVLKEEHKGLFGMKGKRLAKVKATLKSPKKK